MLSVSLLTVLATSENNVQLLMAFPPSYYCVSHTCSGVNVLK